MMQKRIMAALLAAMMLVTMLITAAAAEGITIATPSGKRVQDPAIQAIYDANDLKTILQKHDRVTVTINGYNENNTVNFFRVLEISNIDGGTYVRVHQESAAGTAEMEGTSAMGYIACEWNDGRLEAACSLPGEFLELAQDVYLDSLYLAAYSNIRSTTENGNKRVVASMTYVGDTEAYTETFVTNSSNELISATETVYGDNSGARTEFSFAYDKPYSFPACNVLSKAVASNDVVSLTFVYNVPEYNYSTAQVYRMSKAFSPVVDTQGYFSMFSSADMSQASRIDNISLSGDTTVYVLVTSYQADLEALMKAAGTSSVPVSTPIPTAAPSAAPAQRQDSVYVTKSPTNESCYVGGKAIFVAYADYCTKTTWMLISPDGGTKLLACDAPNYFGTVGVNGLGTDTLTITNIPKSMNGWKVQCMFDGYNGPVYTDLAKISVSDRPKPTPTPTPKPTPKPGRDFNTLTYELADDSRVDINDRARWISNWAIGNAVEFRMNASEGTASWIINACIDDSNDVSIYMEGRPYDNYYWPVRVVLYGGGACLYDCSWSSGHEGVNGCWANFNDSLYDINDIVHG